MLKGPFLSKDWMCACETYEEADWVLLGLPFDGTCSNKPGTRFASQAIRTASWGLEEYSPVADRDFNEVKFFDAGDLEFPLGNRDRILAQIQENISQALADGKISNTELADLATIDFTVEDVQRILNSSIWCESFSDEKKQKLIDDLMTRIETYRQLNQEREGQEPTQFGL